MFIPPTSTTPMVIVDPEKGMVEIKGKSFPERSIDFYFPLIQKIERLLTNSEGNVSLRLAMEYFNTSSSKCLLDVMKVFRRLQANGKKVEVTWYYEAEDDDMREAGEDYAEILALNFQLVPLEEKQFYALMSEDSPVNKFATC